MKQDYQHYDYVIVPFGEDTIPVMSSTKYFYRYLRRDFKERKVSIEWVFGNLDHFGIKVNEAWYYRGANTTNIGNRAEGMTVVPPSLVIGLSEPNFEILDLHFELMEHVDPFIHPNGPQGTLTHYVRKQTN